MADYGIAAEVKPAQFDPLKTMGDIQSVQHGMLANKLLGQEVGGRIAMGRAVTAATDPTTGVTDWDKAASLLAQDKEGAFATPEFSAQAQARRLQQMNLNATQIDLSLKKLTAASDVALSLISEKDKVPLTAENVTGAIRDSLFKTGVLDPNDPHDLQMAASIVQRLKPGNDPSDLASNQTVLGQLYTQLHATTEGLNTLKGAPQLVDTGASIVPTRVSPTTSDVTTAAPITKTLSPSEAVAPDYSTVGPNGQPGVVTKGMAAAAGMGSPGATPPTPVPTGPAAGTVEAQTGAAQNSALQLNQDVNDAGGFSQRMLGLKNAEDALSKAQTGKGGQAIQDWRSLLNTLGVPLSDEDKSKAVSFDLAKKYLTDYANRRGSALGMGTDAARELVHAANPSVDINKASAQDILKVIRGLERMQNAQVAEAQSNNVSAANYASWRASWNRSVDPQGFMADQLSAKQRKPMYDAMSPAEKVRYQNAVKAAVREGYYTLDDLRH